VLTKIPSSMDKSTSINKEEEEPGNNKKYLLRLTHTTSYSGRGVIVIIGGTTCPKDASERGPDRRTWLGRSFA
jgi:hypothetical protein